MPNNGLTSEKAAQNLAIYGKNKVEVFKVSFIKLLTRQFTSPLIYLLILAAIISFFLSSPTDALTIGIILIINAFLGFFQEYRSEKYIEKLNSLIQKNANVRRNGKVITVKEEDVVFEDVVIINQGEVIPADGIILLSESFMADESTISGESEPVKKEKGDDVFSGTVAAHGYCEFKVTATGAKSELGKIASLTSKTRKYSKYEEGIANMSKSLMKVTLSILFLIFLINIVIKGPTIANLITFLMFTITLAISVVPEALPVIATLTLSSGALKLAKKHVVIKRLSSVEELGNIEILCTDKTGTITKNEMTVKDIVSKDKEQLLTFVSFCLSQNNYFDDQIKKIIPLEITKNLKKIKLISFLPFDPKVRRRWTLIEYDSKRYLVVLGAAEEVAKISKNLNLETQLAKFSKIESSGLRMLAVGFKEVSKKFSFAKDFDDSNLNFLGYFTIYDPIRETAVSTLNTAKRLGVQVKIITGDSIEVAKFTASSVHLLGKDSKCFTNQELLKMTPEEFDQACEEGVVFARITPDLKYQIVNSLKKKHTVAYQGDGINDAPALKASNVGIAVAGAAGVAREAADIILMDKDLKVTIEGVQSGRKMFNNIDKYIKHTMVSNWGNFFAVAVVSLFTQFLPLLPIQILITSLFSDIPLLAVSTDNVDPTDLRRPEKYNILELVSLPVFLGTVTAFFNLAVYFYLRNLPLDLRRTVWFLLITVMDLVVIFSVRKMKWMFSGVKPSKILSISIFIWIIASLALPFTPIAPIFHLQKVNASLEIILIVVTIIYLITLDSFKVLYYKKLFDKFKG